MKDATVCKMTESEYRSLPALNASRFKAFIRSPYHFFNQKEVETTEAMKIGTAIHTALLEPENYLSSIAYYPDVDRRTKEGKAIAQAFEEGAMGKTILKHDSQAIVERAVAAVHANPKWDSIQTPSLWTERVLLAKMWDVDCKARLDLIDLETKVIRDIKSCADCSADKFKYDVQDRMYWLQAGFYALLAEVVFGKRFSYEFIAVETSDPSACCFYSVEEDELEKWKSIVSAEMNLFRISSSRNEWSPPENRTMPKLYLNYRGSIQ